MNKKTKAMYSINDILAIIRDIEILVQSPSAHQKTKEYLLQKKRKLQKQVVDMAELGSKKKVKPKATSQLNGLEFGEFFVDEIDFIPLEIAFKIGLKRRP